MRMVGVVDSRLAFVVSPGALPGRTEIEAPSGAILESRHDRPVAFLARRIAGYGGAALIIDYGHAATGFGDTTAGRARSSTCQSPPPSRANPISPRRSISPRSPAPRGREGAGAHGPITQGDFLRRLGIAQRAARLKQKATPQQAADIDSALTTSHRGRPDGRPVQGAGDRRCKARRAAGV
jgi:hypothetical protein